MKQFMFYNLLLLTLCSLSSCDKTKIPTHVSATIGKKIFDLELKLDTKGRHEGMMHRKSLGRNEGMLFVFPKPEVLEFWMKNCLFDLDVIYIDSSGEIVRIVTMKVPGTDVAYPDYSSEWPAQFAIELNAGQARKLGLKLGQKLNLDYERLKKLAH